MIQYNPSISGSLTVTGSIIALTDISGTVNGINVAEFSSSVSAQIVTVQSATGSQTGRLTAIESFTSSTTARLNAIETVSASNISRLTQVEIVSASNLARIGSIESFTSSTTARINSIETVSASNLNRLNSLENKTGSLATTGSNTFIGTQVITGSLYVTTDLIVQGSSSLQNITGSSVNIGTNKVVLNTANPAVRYAGISVIDSGSTGLTGSILWDSTNNNWLYQNPSGSSYASAKFISGPQSQTLGSELGLSTNFLMKAIADDHISSSAIYDDGTTIALKSNTEVSGTFKHNASTASFAGLVGIGTITPTQKLHIDGAIRLTSNPSVTGDASSAHFWNQAGVGPTIAGANFQIQTNGTTSALYIDSSQKIGVGTISPTRILDVRGDTVIYSSNQGYTEGLSVVYTGTAVEGGGINIHSGSVGSGLGSTSLKAYLRIRSNNNFVIGRYTTPSGDYYPFEVVYANGNVLLAKNEGNVGIASSTPGYKLDVVGSSNSGIRLKQGAQIADSVGSANFYNGITFENLSTTHAWSMGYSQGGSFSINYFDAASTYTRIATYTTSGVGIGTTTPNSRLDVRGSSDGDSIISMGSNTVSGILNAPANMYINADSDNDSASGQISFGFNRTGYSGGTTSMTLLENGTVNVAGNISGSGNIVLAGTNLIVNSGKIGWRNQGITEFMQGEAWTTALYNYNNNDGFLIYNRDASDVAHPVFHVGGWNNAGYGGWSNGDSLLTLVRADGTKSEGSTYAGRGLSNSSYYSNIVKTTTKTIFRDIQGMHEFDGSVIDKRSGEIVVYNEGSYATTTGWNNTDTYNMTTLGPFGNCVVHGWNPANKNFTLTLSNLPGHSYIKVEACFHMVDSVDDEWNYFYVSNNAGSDVQLGQWKRAYNAIPNSVTFSNGAFGVWNKGIYYSYRPWGNGTYGNDGFYELNSNWQPHTASTFLTKFITEVDQAATDEAVYISHVKVTVR